MTAGAHTVVVEHYEMCGAATATFSLTKGGGTAPPPPTGDAVNGRWTVASSQMSVRAMHVTALRNGNVLMVAGSGNDYDNFVAGSFKAQVWNPNTGAITNINTPSDMFCSGHVHCPMGEC